MSSKYGTSLNRGSAMNATRRAYSSVWNASSTRASRAMSLHRRTGALSFHAEDFARRGNHLVQAVRPDLIRKGGLHTRPTQGSAVQPVPRFAAGLENEYILQLILAALAQRQHFADVSDTPRPIRHA